MIILWFAWLQVGKSRKIPWKGCRKWPMILSPNLWRMKRRPPAMLRPYIPVPGKLPSGITGILKDRSKVRTHSTRRTLVLKVDSLKRLPCFRSFFLIRNGWMVQMWLFQPKLTIEESRRWRLRSASGAFKTIWRHSFCCRYYNSTH